MSDFRLVQLIVASDEAPLRLHEIRTQMGQRAAGGAWLCPVNLLVMTAMTIRNRIR